MRCQEKSRADRISPQRARASARQQAQLLPEMGASPQEAQCHVMQQLYDLHFKVSCRDGPGEVEECLQIQSPGFITCKHPCCRRLVHVNPLPRWGTWPRCADWASVRFKAVSGRRANVRLGMRFEDPDMNTSSLLLGQCILAVNVEVASRNRGCCVGLTTADADRVIALSNDWIAIFRDHAQIARFQVEMDLLTRAWIEMNARKSSQGYFGCTFDWRELEIELHNFISGEAAGVRNRYVRANRLSGTDGLRRHTQIAITEFRVTQPIAEGIERLAAEVAIGPVCHPVVFEVR